MSAASLYVPTNAPSERAARAATSILYGRDPDEISVLTSDDVTEAWVAEWSERVRGDGDAVVLVWGPAGSGKSTCVLDLARRIDPTLVPSTLAEHYAFRPEHVPTIYGKVPRFGAGIIDEAVSSGLLATDTFSPDQKDLVELINLIRAKNVVLFVLLPDPSDLAKAFRARRADYRIEVEKDGPDAEPIAHVGRRVRGRKFYMDDGKWLGFSDDPDVNPLRWPNYRTSSDPLERALWDAYYPLKMRYLDERVRRIEARMREREARRDKARSGP